MAWQLKCVLDPRVPAQARIVDVTSTGERPLKKMNAQYAGKSKNHQRENGVAMTLKPGLNIREVYTVDFDDLDLNGAGSMPVLATPVLIEWFERACIAATADMLPEGQVTVGMGIDILHISPVPAGCDIEIRAHLAQVERQNLTFHVEGLDDYGIASTGICYRTVVDRHSFLTKVNQKMGLTGRKEFDRDGSLVDPTIQ